RIWKASQTVPFIYRAFAAGYEVPEPLIEAIVRTFLTHVVRGDRILRNLSPIESREVEADQEGGHLDGIVTWLELAAYEPEIADRIRHIFAARPDLFPGGWFGSTNSARGYAHFLGKAGRRSTSGAMVDPERHAETPRP
ncbi:MAG: hypothetical protein GY798_30300, partial [Hyphomicrobiales bacterium]|nr:hypothetical protein [Hyphomicrobiales bacterium]